MSRREFVYIKLDCGIEVPIKLVIAEEHRRVIAISDEKVVGVVFQYIKRKFGSYISDIYFNESVGKRLSMGSEYKTVAVCDKEDVWDDSVGKQLALSRMKDKLNYSVRRRVKFLSEIMKEVSNSIMYDD